MQKNKYSWRSKCIGFEKERCVILGEYIKETGSTVRQTAKKHGISKSTVHKDVTERLLNKDKILYNEVQLVLMKNKSERHLRGGNATKNKYKKEKSKHHV